MGTNPSYFKNCPTCPVDQISWDEAKEYCRKIRTRLPTEAEWEYACRAGSTAKYYWGDGMDGDYCWYDSNSGSKTHPVAQKKPNAFELYDMSGNVFEWCSDYWNYYTSANTTDPIGALTVGPCVLRDGSWSNVAEVIRSTEHVSNYPTTLGNYCGFRCVRASLTQMIKFAYPTQHILFNLVIKIA